MTYLLPILICLAVLAIALGVRWWFVDRDPESEIQEPGLRVTWLVQVGYWIHDLFPCSACEKARQREIPPSVGASGAPEVNPIESGSLGGVTLSGGVESRHATLHTGQCTRLREHLRAGGNREAHRAVNAVPEPAGSRSSARPAQTPSDGSSESESRGVSLCSISDAGVRKASGVYGVGGRFESRDRMFIIVAETEDDLEAVARFIYGQEFELNRFWTGQVTVLKSKPSDGAGIILEGKQ